MAVLPGLPEPTPRWKRELHWSVSRHHTWEHCRRAFWYEVVAPTLPRPPVPFEQFERLRRLGPRGVVKGAAVHQAIEEGIRAQRRGGDGARVARAALDRALRAFALRPAETLAEVAHGRPFEAADLEAARAEGRAMLDRFWATVWPRYALRRYVQHERFERFEAAGVQVRLRLDLVTAGSDGLLLTDWKTGRDRGEQGPSLQLDTYALWATRALGEAPERVRAELVFLPDGAVRGGPRTPADLARAEAAIAASAAAMRALGGFEDAAPSPGPGCVECRWATICDAGRSAAGLG